MSLSAEVVSSYQFMVRHLHLNGFCCQRVVQVPQPADGGQLLNVDIGPPRVVVFQHPLICVHHYHLRNQDGCMGLVLPAHVNVQIFHSSCMLMKAGMRLPTSILLRLTSPHLQLQSLGS